MSTRLRSSGVRGGAGAAGALTAVRGRAASMRAKICRAIAQLRGNAGIVHPPLRRRCRSRLPRPPPGRGPVCTAPPPPPPRPVRTRRPPSRCATDSRNSARRRVPLRRCKRQFHPLQPALPRDLAQPRQHAVLHAAPQHPAAQQERIHRQRRSLLAEDHGARQPVAAEAVRHIHRQHFRVPQP